MGNACGPPPLGPPSGDPAGEASPDEADEFAPERPEIGASKNPAPDPMLPVFDEAEEVE